MREARAKTRSLFVTIGRTVARAFSTNRLRHLRYDITQPYANLLLASNDLGETFVVDAKDAEIGKTLYIRGSFDFKKVENAIEKLKPDVPRRLIDVGANIGPICVPALNRGLFETCVAIEPHPKNCNLLRANIALNGLFGRVTVHECAVGAKLHETLSLEVSPDNLGDHRIRVIDEPGKQGEGSRSIISVPSTTLDSLCDDERSLIWMDTQGYEGFVLLGAPRLLANRNPLVLEFWPYAMQRSGGFPHVLAALSGYSKFYDLDRHVERPIADLPALYDEIGESDPYAFTDILVV